MHRVPAKGEQLTMLSPAGDPRQAVAVPLFWSDDHRAPSDQADALVVTHPLFRLEIENGVLTIECERFNLKGRDGSGISMVDGKLTLKANLIQTDGETRLDKGTRPVHRVQDHDSRGDVALEGAPRVYA
jgi:phage baseplate assembly protein gpV